MLTGTVFRTTDAMVNQMALLGEEDRQIQTDPENDPPSWGSEDDFSIEELLRDQNANEKLTKLEAVSFSVSTREFYHSTNTLAHRRRRNAKAWKLARVQEKVRTAGVYSILCNVSHHWDINLIKNTDSGID